MAAEKPIHTVVLDAGPIIRGDPSVSSLLAQSEKIVTLPFVIQEIRDEATRTRLQTTLLPFLVLKTPKQDSVKVISDFARKTGDLSVLSRVDIQLLALAYDLECERNNGDWRLRKAPGEKRINGPKPVPATSETALASHETKSMSGEKVEEVPVDSSDVVQDDSTVEAEPSDIDRSQETQQENQADSISANTVSSSVDHRENKNSLDTAEMSPNDLSTVPPVWVRSNVEYKSNSLPQEGMESRASGAEDISSQIEMLQVSDETDEIDSDESDSEGWITPSNLKKKQEEDISGTTDPTPEPRTLQVALITSDFAMQNVALQMNLNILSASLHRIRHLKTFVLRCHACFNVVKDTSKQFCPRCGGATLTRVSCSTNQKGEFTLHLKKNMQWNKRGDRFSVPKPVAGASNGRVKGGGKGGWGNGLIFAEDQKEYVRAVEAEKRQKQRNFMDEDYLPSILTGERANSGGRIKVGAGRNVNSRKRK